MTGTSDGNGSAGRTAATVALAVALCLGVPIAAEGAQDQCGRTFSDSDAPDDDGCRFACYRGTIQISIAASDEDATVSGKAQCGGGIAHCTSEGATNECSGSGGTVRDDDSGSCEAVVEELWNSAWNYGCVARTASETDPTDPDCGVLPDLVCDLLEGGLAGEARRRLDAVAAQAATCAGGDVIEARPSPAGTEPPDPREVDPMTLVPFAIQDPCTGTPILAARPDPASGLPEDVLWSVQVRGVGAKATGTLCIRAEGCWRVEPACTETAGRLACGVSSTTRILERVSPSGA